jgi:hypothetical protein
MMNVIAQNVKYFTLSLPPLTGILDTRGFEATLPRDGANENAGRFRLLF